MYYVYIIKSIKDNKFYTGITIDIERKFEEHNRGKYSTPSTLNRGPFELKYVEIVSNRIEARVLEKYFKSGSGREIRNELFQ
jgi:putative endonuclease